MRGLKIKRGTNMKLNKVVLRIVSISFSVLMFLLVIVGLVNLGQFCYGFGYRVFMEEPVDSVHKKSSTVFVEQGMSEHEIGTILEKEGLIRDKNLFFIQLKLSAYSGKIIPGTYQLDTSMTAREMMKIMSTEPWEDQEETEETEEAEDKA